MAVNSFREDEKSSGVSNTVTLKRLLSYLLAYKKQIIIVLLIMAYASTVSLINPLIMESAIDNHIQSGDFKGLLHLAILAIIFIIPVLTAYWETGQVRKFPTLIVCGFTMIAALQAFFSGMILSNMSLTNRREFEIQLNQLHRHKLEGMMEENQ